MYKVRVITLDCIELDPCNIKVAVRLINNGRATVVKMINDNGVSKVSVIQLNKLYKDITDKSSTKEDN